MIYKIIISNKIKKQLDKLDNSISIRIMKYLKRLEENPFAYGKELSGNLDNIRSYGIVDYRILCEVHRMIVEVHVIKGGHRKDIYDQ